MNDVDRQPDDPSDDELDDAVDRVAMFAMREAGGDADLAAVVAAEAAAMLIVSCYPEAIVGEQISDLAQFVITIGNLLLATGKTVQ